MKKKIVLIGMNESGKRHFSELRRSEWFELVGVCDKNPSSDYGRFDKFTDVTKMLSNVQTDAALICCDGVRHKELILQCIKFVKNIYVDMPLITTLEETRELNYAVKNSGAKLVVGCTQRQNPVIISLKKELEKDKNIASAIFIRGSQNNEFDALFNLCVVDIDLMRFVGGSEICDLHINSVSENSKKFDVISCIFKNKNQAIISTLATTKYPHERVTFEICTNSGVYLGDLVAMTLHKITPSGRINLRVDREDYSYRHSHKAFYELCQNGLWKDNATMDDMIKIRELIR